MISKLILCGQKNGLIRNFCGLWSQNWLPGILNRNSVGALLRKKTINFCELRNFGCCTQNLFPRSQTKILARFFIFRKILNLHFFDVWKRFWSCYENLNLEILKDFWANWSFWQPLPNCSVFPAVSRDFVAALLKTDFFEMGGTFWVESSIKKSKK